MGLVLRSQYSTPLKQDQREYFTYSVNSSVFLKPGAALDISATIVSSTRFSAVLDCSIVAREYRHAASIEPHAKDANDTTLPEGEFIPERPTVMFSFCNT